MKTRKGCDNGLIRASDLAMFCTPDALETGTDRLWLDLISSATDTGGEVGEVCCAKTQ